MGENGLIKKAEQASDLTRKKTIEEQLSLIYAEQLMNGNSISTTKDVTDILIDMVGSSKDITQEDIDEFNEILSNFGDKVITVSTKNDIAKIGTDEEYPLDGIYIQLNNITFEADEQVNPIGMKDIPFTGIYNGQNKTINGISINITNENAGMFGVNEGTIKNVKIENYEIVTGYSKSGTIAGVNSGIIINCSTNNGNILSTITDYSNMAELGGICGINSDNGIIKNCTNYSNVTGSGKLIGGICGYNLGGDIESCYNYGIVKGTYQVGGIVGDSEGINENNITYLKKCVNEGNVTGINSDVAYGQVGGIVGCNFKYSIIDDNINKATVESNATYHGGIAGVNFYIIENCINTGEVKNTGTNTTYIGGIVGNSAGKISNSYNTASVSGTMESSNFIGGIVGHIGAINPILENSVNECYNIGNVSGNNFIGGIAGRIYANAYINSCYNNIGNITGNSFVGGIAGDTSSNSIGIANSYNKGNNIKATTNFVGGIAGTIRSKTENCYNTGTVSLESTNPRIGALFGVISDLSNDKIVNCYYLNTSCEKAIGNDQEIGIVEGAISKTNEKMQNLETLLGNEYKSNTENDKYPKLIWEK